MVATTVLEYNVGTCTYTCTSYENENDSCHNYIAAKEFKLRSGVYLIGALKNAVEVWTCLSNHFQKNTWANRLVFAENCILSA